MTDPRKPIFDAIRATRGKGFDQMEVGAISNLLDALDVPREAKADGLTVSPEGIALMHHFEQCRLEAYPDPGSRDGKPWTIGWGATGAGIAKGTVWTQAQADARYEQDLAKFSNGVADMLRDTPTTPAQFDALVSLAYNIGLGNFAGSTLLRMHKAGDHSGAANQFSRWQFNDGKPMRGLLRRRMVEAAHYRGQDWRAADLTARKELGL